MDLVFQGFHGCWGYEYHFEGLGSEISNGSTSSSNRPTLTNIGPLNKSKDRFFHHFAGHQCFLPKEEICNMIEGESGFSVAVLVFRADISALDMFATGYNQLEPRTMTGERGTYNQCFKKKTGSDDLLG